MSPIFLRRPMLKTRQSWRGMKERCGNYNHKNYSRYGGRGIRFPAKWEDFKGFLEDMGLRPPGTELDRKDNNKDYSKDNCQWITHKENTRKSSQCKLTLREVTLIKVLLQSIKPGTLNTKANVLLGDMFKVSRHTIHAIRNGSRWG